MKVSVTEYLQVDLDNELWECRRCEYQLGSARDNYKTFTLIYNRNPQEVHRPLLNPEMYDLCFSPDPKVCVIYEFYCPNCGTLMDVEYTMPGAMPLYDLEIDIDSLREKWTGQPMLAAPGQPTVEITPEPSRACGHNHSGHNHQRGA